MAAHSTAVFPEKIAYGSQSIPQYSTTVIYTRGGKDYRNRNWEQGLLRYDASYGIKEWADAQAVLEFFHARGGASQSFRFTDRTDYKVKAHPQGVGDGATDTLQLNRRYTSAPEQQVRNITQPKAGTLVLYFDDVEQPTGWTLDTATGIVTFDSPPADEVVITADFEFYVPVRFQEDELPIEIYTYHTEDEDGDNVPSLQIPSIILREVRL